MFVLFYVFFIKLVVFFENFLTNFFCFLDIYIFFADWLMNFYSHQLLESRGPREIFSLDPDPGFGFF